MKTTLLKLATATDIEKAEGHLAEFIIDMPAPVPTAEPDPVATACDGVSPGKQALKCTLPAGHAGPHKCRIVRRSPGREAVEEAEWNDPPTEVTDPVVTDPGVTDPGVTDPGVTDPGVTDPGVTDPTPAA